MASKQVIETDRLYIGSDDISGLYVGNTESKYAAITDSDGALTTIYDKVTYNFSVANLSGTVPANGGTYTVTASTSTRTHGNGVVNNVNFSPLTFTIGSNTGSTRSGSQTVTQNSSNLTDTCAWTQEGDYVTNLTLTLGTPSVIPASGGSISSCGYTVKADYKSGRSNVDVTSSATIA